jgi:heme-degrading monooxygenase HmoA
MAAFIHTVTIKAKPGRLADARAEVASLAAAAEANGASSVRLMASMAGDTSEGVLVIEFDSGEAWATLMQSDTVRDARRTRYEEDYPFIVTNTSVFQELAINPD